MSDDRKDLVCETDTTWPLSLLCVDWNQSNPFSRILPETAQYKLIPFSICSAEELQEAGIEFKKKEGDGSFLDIEFDPKGVIKIPYFYFSDNLHSIFQNLIAFEQCYPDSPTYFTGYAAFMDDIINTAKDVQILRHSGVLEHDLGSTVEFWSMTWAAMKSLLLVLTR